MALLQHVPYRRGYGSKSSVNDCGTGSKNRFFSYVLENRIFCAAAAAITVLYVLVFFLCGYRYGRKPFSGS